MAVMGWWRPFTNLNVLFFVPKNTGENCKHRENGIHREFLFSLSVAILIIQ